MSAHELLMRLEKQRVGLLETASNLPTSTRDKDVATSIRDVHEAFLELGEVSKILRTILAFPHEVSEEYLPQPDGDTERIVKCSCGWMELLDHDWTGTYHSLEEARQAHLDSPHMPGLFAATDSVPEYWTGELAASAVFVEEYWLNLGGEY